MPQPAILTIPVPEGGLSSSQYQEIVDALDAWEKDVREACRRYPAHSYELGVEQTSAFLRMLGLVGQADTLFGAVPGETKRHAIEWMDRYALHEIDGALDKYLDDIKSAILYGLRSATNPTEVASWLYKATKDAEVNWRMVARTEMVRANAAGRLDSIKGMGYEQVWAPSHTGACSSCRRLLENRVFDLEKVRNATNYGRKQQDWIAAIPLHPHAIMGGQVVMPVGEWMNASRARWAGPVFTLHTATEVRLAVGPHHPVLTQRGWVQAQHVCVGDNVVSSRGADQVGGLDDHFENMPACVEEVWDSLEAKLRRTRVAASPSHLHGDGAFCQGNVDVVWADGPLTHEALPPIFQEPRQQILIGAGVLNSGFASPRGGELTLPRLDLSSARSIRRRDAHGIVRAGAGGDAMFAKATRDRRRADPEFLRHLHDRLPSDVALDQVVRIDFDPTHQGWAYDFETTTGYYITGGVTIRNCRHVWLPYVKDVFEEAQRGQEALAENGLDDKTLNEMFDPSGQVKPEYEDDPRLQAYFEQTGQLDKSVDPLSFVLGQAIAKHAVAWPDPTGPPAPALDPLVWTSAERLKPEVRDRIVDRWRYAFTADAPLWSHVYLTGPSCSRQWVGKSDVNVQAVVDYHAFREQHPEYNVLSDPELHAVLVTQLRASVEGRLTPDGLESKLHAYVRDEQSLDEFADAVGKAGEGVWDLNHGRWLVVPPDHTEEHGDTLEGLKPEWVTQAQALAGELEDGDTNELREVDEFLRGTNGSFGQFLRRYLTDHGPLATVQNRLETPEMAKVFPAYSWAPDGDWLDVTPEQWPLPVHRLVLRADGLSEIISERSDAGVYKTLDGSELRHVEIAKAAAPTATDAGVEHWITIHPHGPGTDGQPVLVRNSPDGKSMVVVGGAGGHLNYLRIDRSRQIKASDKAPEQGPTNEPSDDSFENKTPEQIKQEENDAQEKMQQAHEQLQAIKEKQKGVQSQLQDYIKGLVDQVGQTAGGEKAGWDDLSDVQQKNLFAKLKASAMFVAAEGPMNKKDVNEAGLTLKLDKDNPDAEPEAATLDQAIKDEMSDELADKPESDDESEPGDAPAKKKMPMIALSTDRANDINTLLAEHGILSKQASKARKIAGGETKGSDAMALDYSAEDVQNAVKQRVGSEQRTRIARDILDTAESNNGKKLMDRAAKQGGYDTLDTFAQAVLGDSQIKPEVARLLGVGGTAQLIAHKLYEEAKAGRLDIDKAYDALDSLTQDREVAVASRARARALKATEQVKEAMEAAKQSGLSTDAGGLWTQTAANSVRTRKLVEAATTLGMAISGLEAASAMKVALQRAVGTAGTRTDEGGATKVRLSKGGIDQIRIGGFPGAYPIKQLAAKAGMDVGDKDIRRLGNGNYELTVDPKKLDHLFQPRQDPHKVLRDALEHIRTAKDDDELVQAQRTTPGMKDTLEPAQARGKMFLLAAQHGLLAFEPGVGKTHTAIAAAMDKMNAEPGKHRVLIIAPKSVGREWRDTVERQGGRHSVQVLGADYEEGDDSFDEAGEANPGKDKEKGANWQKQVQEPCDFNVVSYETLRNHPEIAKQLGATIHIADEAQKAKNEQSGIFQGMMEAGQDPSVTNRWALTGTPIEKNTGDIHSMLQWANPEGLEDQNTFREKYDKTAQYEHLTSEDRIRQFREGISERMFHLAAADAGSDLPTSNADNDGHMHIVPVELSDAHKEMLRQKVQDVNEQNADLRARRAAGERDSSGKLIRSSLPFGGRDVIMRNLHKPEGIAPEDHAIAQKVAELCDTNPGSDYDGKATGGQNAGHYDGKTVVFAEQVQHLAIVRKALEAKGIKVFEGHGSKSTGDGHQLTNAENSNNIRDYLAYKGKAVFLSSDKNNAGINLQLGTAKGHFQHGANRMVHLTLPMNNAKIAQREARIHRRGSVAPVDTYHVTANTPFEKLDRDRLGEEKRRMDLVGNREDDVKTIEGGHTETMRQRYTKAGGKLASEQPQEAQDERAA